MKLNYLIDGYNLGFKDSLIAGLLKKGQTDRAIDLIVRRVRQGVFKAERILVVFDGQKFVMNNISSYAGVEVVSSRKPQSADDIIRQKLRNLTDASNWVVVSSDHEILNTARAMGARFMRSEEFLKATAQKQGGSGNAHSSEKYNPTNVNVDYWLEQFKRGTKK